MLPVLALLAATLTTPAPGVDDALIIQRYIASRSGRSSAAAHALIPSFSRQTGLPCNACHTVFPELNAFGRMFKLNGYTLTGRQTIQTGDSGSRESLKIDLVPPLSAMLQTSVTAIRSAPAGVQNETVQMPQQLSLFLGGAITPNVGTFLQLTYDPGEGKLGLDNADFRFASHVHVGPRVATVGLTLNNNPSVSDVWNTLPAWGYPYASSAVALAPGAAALLDGALGQRAAGLGGYLLFDSHWYGELGVYRTADQGGPAPSDSTSTDVIHGVAPYWRAFYQFTTGGATMMLGTFGMNASIHPQGVEGLRNRFTDVGLDAQVERPGAGANLSAHAIYLHESQRLPAAVAAGAAERQENSLNTVRVNVSAYTRSRAGLTLGYFQTTGGADPVAYPAGAVTGYAAGRPDTRGVIGELTYLPWLNTRLSLQYVRYGRFNGAGADYDGAGRSAGDNDTIYLLAWLVF